MCWSDASVFAFSTHIFFTCDCCTLPVCVFIKLSITAQVGPVLLTSLSDSYLLPPRRDQWFSSREPLMRRAKGNTLAVFFFCTFHPATRLPPVSRLVSTTLWRTLAHHTPRTLSLRNLVLRYECRRVILAGVGPDSPSRDAANWLSSQFSRSVETRQRYGWLRMVFPRYAPLPSSNWMSFGRWWHARGRGHCRG